MSKFLLIVGAILLATASANVLPEKLAQGQEVATTSNTLKDLYTEGKLNLLNLFGFKSEEEAKASLKARSENLQKKLAAFQANLKKKSDEIVAKMQANLKKLKEKFAKIVEEFKQNHPELTENAKKVNEKFHSLATDAKNFGESLKNVDYQQKFKEAYKTMLDKTSETVDNLKASLKQE